MRTANWTYTRYKDGSEELYDMKNDPGQFTNRASDVEAAVTLAEQRKAFERRLEAADIKAARLR